MKERFSDSQIKRSANKAFKNEGKLWYKKDWNKLLYDIQITGSTVNDAFWLSTMYYLIFSSIHGIQNLLKLETVWPAVTYAKVSKLQGLLRAL